ncbi:hypothetical protein F4821DRAFT_260609 [Hypoxylon rubiginosum]|uniref:Uncharacterized protein n=1 Tax=Hypoxylon rubiginosum TaxID=110542 RepID=A0ACC0CYX4_9PEZI|nr:hypothetical protein F4821DRAFT_260609 [Hypoxylon rubiginosum]
MQFTTAFIAAAIADFSFAMPTTEKRFVSGQCGIHVTQFQKNENGVGSEYQFTVQIKDAVGDGIGGVKGQAIADRTSFDILPGPSNELPAKLTLTAGSVDSDPITFAYNGQSWSSSSGCSTGGYQNGNREMDCGFAC